MLYPFMHLIINTCLNRLKLLYKLISRYFFCIMTTTCEHTSRCMLYKKFPKYPIRHSLFKKKKTIYKKANLQNYFPIHFILPEILPEMQYNRTKWKSWALAKKKLNFIRETIFFKLVISILWLKIQIQF